MGESIYSQMHSQISNDLYSTRQTFNDYKKTHVVTNVDTDANSKYAISEAATPQESNYVFIHKDIRKQLVKHSLNIEPQIVASSAKASTRWTDKRFTMPEISIEMPIKDMNSLQDDPSLLKTMQAQTKKEKESYFRKRFNRSYVPFISERNSFG